MATDPYRYFRIEARELLDQLIKGTLDLEKSQADAQSVVRLLRLAHTLKGAARVVKLTEIADLAHAIEDALAPYRENGQAVPRQAIDALLARLDATGSILARLPSPAADSSAPPAVSAEAPVRLQHGDVAEVDAILEGLGEIGGELAQTRRTLAGAKRAADLAALMAAQLAAPRPLDARQSAALAKTRAIAKEVHDLIVGLTQQAAASVERIERERRGMRETTERLRLVPASAIFNALERTVRDAAHQLGKRVVFEASGAEVRIDGPVLDTVAGALVQIVRNAVAHGIETESERTAAGKPPAGRVTLAVARRGHRVSFRCRDDGRGVDLEAVRRAAEKKGGLPQNADRLAPAELLRVLMKGGISTSGKVTELSGRGIGLDVVRAAADRLGGELSVETHPGAGTSIEIDVPVSLALIEALIVESNGELAAIPLDAVRAARRLAPAEISVAPAGKSIAHEDELIPLIPLSHIVAGNGARAPMQGGQSAVVVGGAESSVALAVDRLRGTESIVLRPLPKLAPLEAVVAGVHLDAEGNPRSVLDADALTRWAKRRPLTDPAIPAASPPILVIDDSLTTRMLEQSILESAGYDVALAASGEEALELARRNRYALFLVDVEMPGMDGFTFIERTRADPALRGVPCILVTSRDSQEDRHRGERAGAYAYIVKNEFNQVQFLERVASSMRA